ncbi:MAG: hypothetical protein CMK83_19340 [Pseudomonadales bacterium]|nr:hypothetical protein [Pseudomonadales bacterium]TNC84807.1 MAG: hypothetical protein CSH49_18770 [Alcanivorax sp.]HAG93636.1 hypothetical protein [Gammaproteobacteria bacterium]MAQ26366.1 hypothetical protein [Pseudomonadales bacterium]HAU15182.1 hypothetical protein [Gammaproteobacteria bacterium]
MYGFDFMAPDLGYIKPKHPPVINGSGARLHGSDRLEHMVQSGKPPVVGVRAEYSLESGIMDFF